jgi:hypothetical protein
MDVPLSSQARQFYKSGAPLLHRYLPFWLAVLVEQLLILLIPVLGLLYPALRALPAIYYGAMERRVLALYKELKELEGEMDRAAGEQHGPGFIERIDDLEARTNRLRVPARFTQSLFQLKWHISLVRTRFGQTE